MSVFEFHVITDEKLCSHLVSTAQTNGAGRDESEETCMLLLTNLNRMPFDNTPQDFNLFSLFKRWMWAGLGPDLEQILIIHDTKLGKFP